MADPCGEDSPMPVTGLSASVTGSRAVFSHRPVRQLLPLLHTESRGERSSPTGIAHRISEEAIRHLETDTQVRDVLFSGGDALLFSDERLE